MSRVGGWIRPLSRNFSTGPCVFINNEDAMKAYLASRSSNAWALAGIAVVLIAYPIARVVVPAVIHAVVPDVVRTVLNLI